MPNFSKKTAVKISSPKQGFANINWPGMRDAYLLASQTAAKTAYAELESRVRYEEDRLAQLLVSPEGGAYEGSVSESSVPVEMDYAALEVYKDKCGQAAVKAYTEQLGLVDWSHVFMPEIITLLAGLTLKRNDNNLISGMRFRNEHFTSPEMKGLYYFLMMDARSSYLKTQYKAPNSSYCSLVPTIMYAHKLVHGVKYSEWDASELKFVVHPQLREAMQYKPEPMTLTEIMHERLQGLTVRSGPAAGQVTSAVWKHRLAGPQLKLGIFKGTPYLAQVMLAQIWCAHPDNRSAYMILDPQHWDRVPKALVTKEVLATPVYHQPATYTPQTTTNDIPWDV